MEKKADLGYGVGVEVDDYREAVLYTKNALFRTNKIVLDESQVTDLIKFLCRFATFRAAIDEGLT